MYYFYRIRSRQHPEQTFMGVTRNIKKRLALHNTGQVKATRDYTPWKVSFYAAFSRKSRAEKFLEYMNSPLGKEFGDKHFWRNTSEDADEV